MRAASGVWGFPLLSIALPVKRLTQRPLQWYLCLLPPCLDPVVLLFPSGTWRRAISYFMAMFTHVVPATRRLPVGVFTEAHLPVGLSP